MLASYHIDSAGNLIVLTFTGAVSAKDFEEARRRVLADPAYKPELSALLDLFDSDLTAIPSATLRTQAQFPPPGGANGDLGSRRGQLRTCTDVCGDGTGYR